MENNKDWYDNKTTVDILLFTLFPIGLYAIIKTEKIKFKATKILYGILGLISFLMILMYV